MKKRLLPLFVLLVVFTTLRAYSQKQTKTNYDENKVPAYTLPELLRTTEGEPVTTVKQWETNRRPELLSLFTEQMYGKLPNTKIKASYNLVESCSTALNGRATRKQVEITFQHKGMERKALLLMYLPNETKKPVPVFLQFNFQGNQTVSNDPAIIPSAYSTHPRGNQISRWPIEMIVKAGYGVATIHYFDFYPDQKELHPKSILPFFGYESEANLADTDGQAIAAWAWGYSRMMDYLEKDKQVDAKKVIIMGHSRLGKTALWAGVNDKRFAIIISNNSGCGGAALSKREFGETVNRINQQFPHWFCKNFRQYNLKVQEMPFDQHQLLALVAPRPLYVASAVEDQWADPKGEFLSAAQAGEVFQLYGMKGLETFTMPSVNQPIMNRIAYHIRTGKHDVTDFDWKNYILFADKWLK